jgi:hypothetical protein
VLRHVFDGVAVETCFDVETHPPERGLVILLI